LRRRPKEELARGLRGVDERAEAAEVAEVADIADVTEVDDAGDSTGTLASSARVLRPSILFLSGCGPASFTRSTYKLLKPSVPRIC